MLTTLISLIGYEPVLNCSDREVIDELPNNQVELPSSQFTNNPNPNMANQMLTRESIEVTGLEEFVSYVFEVTVETAVGPDTQSPQSCNTTEEDG